MRASLSPLDVIPAKAGISCRSGCFEIPAFAGMTGWEMIKQASSYRRGNANF